MQCRSVILALVTAVAIQAAGRKPVTLEDVVATRPAGAGAIEWSPDGRTFLYEEAKKVMLYDVAARSARELVSVESLEAKAVKPPEPDRMDWQNRRVTEKRLQWSSNGEAILLKIQGDLFHYRLRTGEWEQLTATAEAEADPKLSPDGAMVAFRRGHDLYVTNIRTKKVTRLTRNGSEARRNAELDWVYPEELGLGTAYWWSPDSRRIAYLQFDVSRQPLYPHGDVLKISPVYEPQRYPKAGNPNAEVRLGVVAARGGTTRWMNTGENSEALLARVDWTPDGRSLLVQRLNRIQNRLDLLAVNAAAGTAKVLLSETDPYWVNLGDELRFVGSDRFLWSSERSGFRHLYLYSRTGGQLAQLTEGDWEVTGVAGIDENAERVYFLSTEASPLERQLYSVRFDGSGKQRITSEAGTHTIAMAPDARHFLGSHSSLTEPPRRVLRTANGEEWAVFREADREVLSNYEILPTEIVSVRASDGETMYAKLIRPAGFDAAQKYPAIVMVYGGPHAQAVRNAWSGLSWEQALAHQGFVIWQLDNRGSAGRGHAWEARLFRRFGKQELADQQEGVRHLLSMGFVDPARLGIYGWSYGGYMTLYALLNAPDLFRAGIAGAPVTDWRNYDTIYTERYLGLPSENPEGYKDSSPVHQAENLRASLMIVQNLGDDNVLFANTIQMTDALQKAGKQFELMLYPQKSHAVTGPVRKQMLEAMTAFFRKKL
ncbi:MAG: S9 family peptidase [Bryobacteraceae bacterium]